MGVETVFDSVKIGFLFDQSRSLQNDRIAGGGMNFTLLKNRTVNELLSITGIMAVFFYLDVKLQFIAVISDVLLRVAPGFSNYLLATVSSLWAGLLVYSYFRRRQTMSALRAKKHVEAELESQKLINTITGIPNRKGFERVVNDTSLLLDHPYWTVLAIEISNIKPIKNVHGIETGFAAERAIVDYLKEITHENEFIAHDDATVFYVVCTSEAEDEVRFRVDQIVEKISVITENGIELDARSQNVQFKFAGINCKFIDRTLIKPELDGLAKRLGFALQQPRIFGNNGIVNFDDAMEVIMQRQLFVEASLHEAIKSNKIEPKFQPIIDIKTSQIIGFEVLARWNHPVKGAISPEVFVPVAEEQGLLGALTISILEQSCIAVKKWPEHITLAINISPTDLQNDVLVIKLIEVLHAADIDPKRVEIEITENAFIEDALNVNRAVTRLKNQGISISIDDFGTGYSSLKQLRSIPFDKIKIDQSFIKDLATNPESRAIVKSIIALGDSLGLATIAEGIEIGDNHDVLKQLGCKLGQGYFFAKPMSGNSVLKLFEENDGLLERPAKVA